MAKPSVSSELTWPGFIEARGATLRQAVDGLSESQHWPLEELREGQRRQFLQLLRSAAKHVPWYSQASWPRALLGASPDALQFWDEWQTIPLLTKAQLRDHGDLLNARSLPAAHLPLGSARTSGSVGIPVEIRTTTVSRLTWSALTVREHQWRERDPGKRLGIIRSRKEKDRAPGGSDTPNWGPPVAELYKTGSASVIHIGLPIPRLIEWLRRFDPHYLLTYPSLAAELVDRLGVGGRTPALEEVRLMSEPVDAALEARLREAWAVRVADVYSANEVGNIAIRCRQDRLHVQAEAILVEILDDAGRACVPGETGRVIVTALHNIATPLIRYEIGDYATVGSSCPCGRDHPVIDKVLGRVRNLVRTPDGRSFWPTALLKVRAVGAIRQFQYVQTALDRIELRVVLDRELTPAEDDELRSIVRRLLQYPFLVDVRPVAAIERGPTGKFEEFRSEIAQ